MRASPAPRPGRGWAFLLLLLLFLLGGGPREASAQFSSPCEVECALVLGASGFTAATGAVVSLGRIGGGLSTIPQGLWAWGTAFTLVVSGGLALQGNGERQRRAVYGAGTAAIAGAAVGFTVETLRTRSDGPRVLAGTFMGAALGVAVGGLYGALSYDARSRSGPVPLFTVRLPH